MISLQHKVDFAVVLSVKHANPNGDPLNGNRPRIDYNGYGEITDVCIKRKLRDRLAEEGYNIFVQSDDRKNDDARNLRDRAEKALGNKFGSSETVKLASETWFDVRAFGQLFAMPKKANGRPEDGDTGISIPIRGPVTVQSAFSLSPIDVTSTQITKSASSGGDGIRRGSDTMGMKHRVDNAVYVFYGTMNPQLAERTGFCNADAEVLKGILPRLFENDASSARPEGSMSVLRVIWWKHRTGKCGQYSSAKVHGTLKMKPDGSYILEHLEGLIPEEIEGF